MGLDKDLELVRGSHLNEGKEVLAAVSGNHVHHIGNKEHQRNGTLIATDRRVAFFRKNLTGFDFDT